MLGPSPINKTPTSRYADLWLGGRGFNTRILYEEVDKDTDPLGPDNVILFSLGPFTGTMVPGSGRVEIAAKSPVTGIQGMSNMGGYWGPELKYAGYDSVIVKGMADQPVYLSIYNDQVEIKDATHLMGKDTYQTQDAIRDELADPEIEVVCIGPAGENIISYASIHNRVGNAAGRTGMGTVMGSKKLKAIAVRGTKGVTIAQPERFMELCLEAIAVQKPLIPMAKTTSAMSNDPPTWALTLGNYEATQWVKQKEFRNGHKPFWEKHKNMQGLGITGCFNCQVRCMDYYDYQGLGPLVASCNCYASTSWVLKDDDMESWYTLVSKCQRQGVDVMSAARMIAWAMELFEKGIINEKDTDGLELTWGDKTAISKMVDQIAKNKGFGAVLASNVFDAAAKVGKDVEEALNIKGVPLGSTNVVNFRARTIGAAINPRGSDEYRGRMGSFDTLGSGKSGGMTGMALPESWEAKAAIKIIEKAKDDKPGSGNKNLMTQHSCKSRGAVAALANRYSIVSDSLGQCKWNTLFLNVGISIEFQARAMSAGLGKQIEVNDLLETASRISTQERLFAIMCGLTRKEDTLPKKLINYQIPGSWPEDKVTPEELEFMKNDFYEAMNWDQASGVPTKETLKKLSVPDLIKDLGKMDL